jgi:hypothetical protein
MSEERKKRKKSSGANTQDDTDANGELDSCRRTRGKRRDYFIGSTA